MEYVRLGQSGLKVSRIGLGMMSYGDPRIQEWALDEAAAERLVRQAVEAGVTFFDTADMYSNGVSEQITGRLLASLFPDRDDYVIATKVFYAMGNGANDRGLSRKHVLASVDASLRRLGTDHIDLYQIHRWDEETPIEETMEALDDIVRIGKVRYIGASTMHAWQFAKAQHAAHTGGWQRFVSMQCRYNLVNREVEREMIPLCADQGVGVVPYSPLARGLLAGTRGRDGARHTLRAASEETRYRDADFDVVDGIRAVAGERDVPPAQIALAWLLAKDGVSAPIIGATKPRHVAEAIAALGVALTGEETARLEVAYAPHPMGEHT
jgi:aryl-alcohol dehydrogenase-like predicted oxidoreductase